MGFFWKNHENGFTKTLLIIFICMDRDTLIKAIADQHMVEGIVCNIAGSPVLGADMRDLCQEVYLALMEYDLGRLTDLWESGAMRFFIARIVLNQWRSVTSPFYAKIRRFRRRSVEIEGKEFGNE